MIKPVPQFALEGNLFYIQSIQADQYSKRDFVLADLTSRTTANIEDNATQSPESSETNADSFPVANLLKRRQTKKRPKTGSVSADAFVAFWFGAMGACLQKA